MFAALLLMPCLSGCVAVAAIPPLAGLATLKISADERVKKRMLAAQARQSTPTTVQTPQGQVQVIPGMTALPPPDGVPMRRATTTTAANDPVPDGMRYLYGSGEGAALSVQAYQSLLRYLEAKKYTKRDLLRQVVMSDGSTLAAPQFEPCGDKPLAAVFDVDETALLNLGYESDAAKRGDDYDDARWQRWERTGAMQVSAVPGAAAAMAEARKMGVTIIFNSNRNKDNADATVAALNGAGLGPVEYGKTLWLKGDDGGGSNKDDRRWAIASGYCVIALVGDQLGDFTDLFNTPDMTPTARRAASESPSIAALWGNGWFVLPNPVYGTGLKGGFDDVFPADKRWSDPAEGAK